MSKQPWTRESAVLDYIKARVPKLNARLLSVFQRGLNGLGIVNFADFERVKVANAWSAIVPGGSGALFTCMIKGMRITGSRFEDWDMRTEGAISDLRSELHKQITVSQVVRKLSNNCVTDVAILRRLAEADLLLELKGVAVKSANVIKDLLDSLE